MQEGKTIGQLMEKMRQKAGAQNYHGHDYMDLHRFCQIRAMKKLWTVRQRGRSRFSAMQKSEMEICFMTTKNRYDRRNPI